jgi:chorismate dehydratase
MPRLRISAISFLNTAPLMWDFEHTALGQQYDIAYTIPSLCAEALRAGTADIGLIPVVAYLTIPDLVIVPDIAIAAKGAVRSILLVSKMPLEKVRSVAADTSSRTSVALCDLLFRRWFPAQANGERVRQFVRHPPEMDSMLAHHDAALLIGDSALRVDRTRYLVLDLAQEWHAMSGRPFVFAFWAVRAAAIPPGGAAEMVEDFRNSRDHGLEPASLDVIARQWSPRVGISEADVRSYLTENISFDLDDENLSGLQLFLRYAAEDGVLPPATVLRFMGEPKSAAKAGKSS